MNALEQKLDNFAKSADADVVKAAKYTVTEILPELKKLQADAPIIEGIAALAGPDASHAASVGVNLITWAINVVTAAQNADASKGLSVTLDASLVTAVKSVATAIKVPTATAAKAA